jgi:hypothetical protein
MGLGDGIAGGSGLGDGIGSDSGQSNGMNGDPTGGDRGGYDPSSGFSVSADGSIGIGTGTGLADFGGFDSSTSGEGEKSFAEKALGALWGATKNAVAYGLTQNAAVQGLESALNTIGIDIDFKDEVKGLLDKGLTRDEAVSQVSSNVTSSLEDADIGDDARSEIMSTLAKATDFAEADDPMSHPDSFEFFANQFANTEEGKAIITDMYNGSAQLSKQQFETLKETTEKQNGLLDSLIDQSQTGTGLFSPISFTIQGQEVSFVPRSKRAQAAQEATLGQDIVGNQTGLLTAALGLDALKQKWDIAQMQDENTDTAQEFHQEASEPGVLDWIQAIGSLF